MLRKLKKWWKRSHNHRYVNGGKGVISIFLAALMIPCVLQADMLIESSRYHAVASALDEIMDLSASSTLANYDDYLLDRFGLLAVDQGAGKSNADQNLTDIYRKYFDANLSGSRIAWKSDSVTVKGLYPLTDSKVLKNQIMEVSKLAAPTEFAASTVMDLIDMLTEDAKGLKVINSCLDAATAVVDEIDNIAKTVENVEDLLNTTQEFETLKNQYNGRFTIFKNAAEVVAAVKRNIAVKEQEVSQKRQEAVSEQNTANNFLKQIEILNRSIEELHIKFENEEITEEEYTEQKAGIDKQIKELDKKQKDSSAKSLSAQTAANKAQQELTDEENALQAVIDNAEDAKNEYAKAILNVKTALEKVDEETDRIIESMKSIAKGAVDISDKFGDADKVKQDYDSGKEIEKMDEQIAELREQKRKASDEEKERIDQQIEQLKEKKKSIKEDTKKRNDDKIFNDNINKAIDADISATEEIFTDALEEYDKSTIVNVCGALQILYNRIINFNCSNISPDFVCEKSVYYVALNGYISSEILEEMLQKLEKEYDSTGDDSDEKVGLITILKYFSEIFDDIFKINVFYDASLDAVIKTDIFANESGGIDDVFTSIAQVSKDFKDLTSESWQVWKLVKKFWAVVKLGKDLIKCVKCITAYAESMAAKITGIGELFKDGVGGAYEKLILSDYLNLICANRTTYDGGKSILTGYSFSNAGMGNSSHSEDTIFLAGDITAVVNTVKNFGNGDSKQFSGAETEYLLTGSRSELLNQTAVFMQLYFLRLILDVIPVLKNPEVKILAGASTLGAPLVYLLYAVLEPFLDTVFLVNGNKLDFIKDCVYLTPTGFATGLGRITNMKFDSADKSAIRTKFDRFLKKMNNVKDMRIFNGRKGKKDDDSFFSADYSTYMMIFLVMQKSDISLKRFSNIILTESKSRKASFDIGKTYTYISAEAKGEYDPFLSAAAVITNFVYSGSKKQVRGY